MVELDRKKKEQKELIELENKLSKAVGSFMESNKKINDIKLKLFELDKEVKRLERDKYKISSRYDKAIALLLSLMGIILIPVIMYKFLEIFGGCFMIATGILLKSLYGAVILIGSSLILFCLPKLFSYISNVMIEKVTDVLTNSREYKKKCDSVISKEYEIKKLNEDKRNLENYLVDNMFERSKYSASLKIKRYMLNNYDYIMDENDALESNDEMRYPIRSRIRKK